MRRHRRATPPLVWLTDAEDELLKKLAEEASEVIMACKDKDHDHIRYEAGGLVYHLLVTLERYGHHPRRTGRRTQRPPPLVKLFWCKGQDTFAPND